VIAAAASTDGETEVPPTGGEEEAYVMNAGGEGRVQGFRITGEGLKPLRGSHRSLGLDNDKVPLFSSSPGQAAFTPDGRSLVVTTKSANTVEVFPMRRDGRPAHRPVINDSAGEVPFAITFDRGGRMLVAEVAKSTVSTYRGRADGRLKVVQQPLPNGQDTLCWLERAGDFFYGGNTGNSTVTGYRTDAHGRLALTKRRRRGHSAVGAVPRGHRSGGDTGREVRVRAERRLRHGRRLPRRT
jgi:6-phosphogluconolactonase (cycloisomerase 2 family)